VCERRFPGDKIFDRGAPRSLPSESLLANIAIAKRQLPKSLMFIVTVKAAIRYFFLDLIIA
jgi:hypothetical protein